MALRWTILKHDLGRKVQDQLWERGNWYVPMEER